MCTKRQYLLCKRARKGKQEGHKIPTKCKQKVNRMFVNNVLKSNVFYLKRLFPNDDIMNILFIITMKN